MFRLFCLQANKNLSPGFLHQIEMIRTQIASIHFDVHWDAVLSMYLCQKRICVNVCFYSTLNWHELNLRQLNNTCSRFFFSSFFFNKVLWVWERVDLFLCIGIKFIFNETLIEGVALKNELLISSIDDITRCEPDSWNLDSIYTQSTIIVATTSESSSVNRWMPAKNVQWLESYQQLSYFIFIFHLIEQTKNSISFSMSSSIWAFLLCFIYWFRLV